MNDWDPATEAEAAMRDALAATDQELYFRILARSELLLPISADALAGRAPMGWGTWTTGNRTHILAFTSPTALHICLNEPSGTFRAVPFQSLAADWPNYEWWLAINPGLPIEAYLPSWFVSQLTRGDVRLPGRTMGARARMAQSDLAAALSGRVRASGPAQPAAAPPPPSPPPPAPSRTTGLGAAVSAAFADGSLTGAVTTSRAPAGPGPASSGTNLYTPSGTASPPPTRATGSPVAAAVVSPSNGRSQPVETVDAEIIDYPPAGGSPRVYATGSPAGAGFSGPGYGSTYTHDTGSTSGPGYGYEGARGYDTSRAYDRTGEAERTAGYDGGRGYDGRGYDDPGHGRAPDGGTPGPGQASGGFFQTPDRDLGARLRERLSERIASSSRSSVGFADGEPTIAFTAERPAAATASAAWTPRQAKIQDAEIVANADTWAVGFAPANETESNLLAAADENNTDAFLSTLLLARVILPVPVSMPPGSRPRDKYFPWQIEETDGQRFVAVFTSPERMAEHGRFGPEIISMSMRFIELIGSWPSENISFSINPGTPVGATLPGSQIVALAAWAADVGLRDDAVAEIVVAAKKNESVPSMGVAGAPTAGAAQATVMQRSVPPSQLAFYLERGYDRVSGFVNRASEVAHLTTPKALYRALGLLYSGSPFTEDDGDVHVLRWVAHRADLYRLPYGGPHEAGMRAMQGWVIERPPFRGNGFAPGDTDVVAEFKVDSARLPHGAQMWRLGREGGETLVASFDADAGRWVNTP